jgi:hypothetical protein
MNLKERKALAREVLEEAIANEVGVKTKCNFVGLSFNENGNFYSAMFEVELSYKGKQGNINMVKNFPLPISFAQDVVIPEKPKEKEKKKKTSVK